MEPQIHELQHDLIDHESSRPLVNFATQVIASKTAAAASHVHLALDKQCPIERAIMTQGPIVEIAEVGGLHHRYERLAA